MDLDWTEVNDLNTARTKIGGCGTQTAAIAFGGQANGSDNPCAALTELWNGTNWTEVNDLNQARYFITGIGNTNTAALAANGEASNDTGTVNTELWNGTNWTEVNNLNTARNKPSGSGLSTAALFLVDKQIHPHLL